MDKKGALEGLKKGAPGCRPQPHLPLAYSGFTCDFGGEFTTVKRDGGRDVILELIPPGRIRASPGL
jgi:hypothetical protein